MGGMEMAKDKGLTVTQQRVLKVLYEHKDESLSANDIQKKSKELINMSHIMSAVKNFMNKDWVYQPDIEGKVQISPDGKDAYLSSI
jgi:Fe2+ or Zn2+ uptake regulation protein